MSLPGKRVKRNKLRLNKAIKLVQSIENSDFNHLVECIVDKKNKNEIIIYETEPEISQRKIYDIHSRERIALIIADSNENITVLALRLNFPLIPHIFVIRDNQARPLCITDKTPEEYALRWTAEKFLEEIREWLKKSSQNLLHQPDQLLEHVFAFDPKASIFILPSIEKILSLFPPNKEIAQEIRVRSIDDDEKILITEDATLPRTSGKEISFATFLIKLKPHIQAATQFLPENLDELHETLSCYSFDLISLLINSLSAWSKTTDDRSYLNKRLLLIVLIPKAINTSATREDLDFEIRAFQSKNSIKEIGVTLGIWELPPVVIPKVEIVPRITNVIPEPNKIKIESINNYFPFSQKAAQHISGISSEIVSKKFCLIGLGSAGSNIYNNLLRMGINKWDLIDDDIFLPHNISKHILGKKSIGHNKVDEIMKYSSDIFEESQVSVYATNIFNALSTPHIKEALNTSDVIIDTAASIAVSRFLSLDIKSTARRISIFFNPAGTDLIVILEDRQRKKPIDILEMRYYRYLLDTPQLHKHLQPPATKYRYSTSCRHVSNNIPQSQVAILTGIASGIIPKYLLETESKVSIWKLNPDDFSIIRYDIDDCEIYITNESTWEIITDNKLIEKVQRLRIKKLPNETGGALIGAYDMKRKRIYVVDTILSPRDSIEGPDMYIRGIQALQPELKKIEQITGSNLIYIGEWHSHPRNSTCNQSPYDKNLFKWMINGMKKDGLPALMLIVGDENYKFYLE